MKRKKEAAKETAEPYVNGPDPGPGTYEVTLEFTKRIAQDTETLKEVTVVVENALYRRIAQSSAVVQIKKEHPALFDNGVYCQVKHSKKL